jgi:hypothetical protein
MKNLIHIKEYLSPEVYQRASESDKINKKRKDALKEWAYKTRLDRNLENWKIDIERAKKLNLPLLETDYMKKKWGSTIEDEKFYFGIGGDNLTLSEGDIHIRDASNEYEYYSEDIILVIEIPIFFIPNELHEMCTDSSGNYGPIRGHVLITYTKSDDFQPFGIFSVNTIKVGNRKSLGIIRSKIAKLFDPSYPVEGFEIMNRKIMEISEELDLEIDINDIFNYIRKVSINI